MAGELAQPGVWFNWDATVYYPSDLLEEYRKIPISSETTTVTVAVTKYRNARNAADQGGTKDTESVKDGLIGASKGKIIAEAGGATRFVSVFTGKGSPEDIGRVLGLVLKYKDDFVKLYKKAGGPRGECARLLEQHKDAQPLLQAFCDAHVGLDCNGFVGNYAVKIKAKGLGPQNGPKQFYERRRGTRNTMDDMVNLDVIVWADFSHIAVIDTFDTLTRVNIAQSTGGGPQMTSHSFVQLRQGLFRISPPTRVGGSVYVVSLGWP